MLSRSDQNGVLTSNSGPWGGWGQVRYCAEGRYATGFRMRVESPISGDDTAANSVILRCDDGEAISPSNGGPWGGWSGFVNCPSGEYITGFKSRVD